MDTLRILQIGAGSMGTRRLRDLPSAANVQTALLDARADRRKRAADRFGIPTFDTLERALEWKPHALSISTPPDRHESFVNLALERGLHHFCEANIWTPDVANIERKAAEKRVVCAPSNSLCFLPIFKELRAIVQNELGRLQAWQMALNTYMPGWHPDEGLEYYARHRNTAAGREMVPFELLFLHEVFGRPAHVQGTVAQNSSLAGVKEATWSLQLQLENGATGQLTVLMGSPAVLRQGWCFGDAGQAHFDLVSGEILCQFQGKADRRVQCGATSQVLEEAYRQEMLAYVRAIRAEEPWPFPYRATTLSTAALAAAERSNEHGRREPVDASRQPAILI